MKISVESTISDLKGVNAKKKQNKKLISNSISKSKELLSYINKELKFLNG